MKIQQFEDKGLAHFGYAILSEVSKEVLVIDPARDPRPYYDFAAAHQAKIVAIVETHPHADFVSSHFEIAQATGAPIYVSKLLGAEYPHKTFDDGDTLSIGELTFKAMNTPGHSPDSICILLEEKGQEVALFTGDTLFIGDVGRPDLREKAGNITAKREELARMMYQSTRDKIMKLADNVLVYPAHGSGSLCGKALSDASYSTIGAEKISNYALQPMTEEAFVKVLLEDQPFIPKYFPYDVGVNKRGAEAFLQSVEAAKRLDSIREIPADALLIDARPEDLFKQGHLPGAINLQNGGKFETWLGSIVGPEEHFYLIALNDTELEELITKTAKIGYEKLIAGALAVTNAGKESTPRTDVDDFSKRMSDYTIVDIRNSSEAKNILFANAINIPLPELRERAKELPTHKPIMVHCAGGYRSAAGSSIIEGILPKVAVYDLSVAVTKFPALEHIAH